MKFYRPILSVAALWLAFIASSTALIAGEKVVITEADQLPRIAYPFTGKVLELIEDKEAGPDKRRHLERLAETLNLPFPEMTFVDDKVNHLDAVAALGVRGALAGWGYNGPREHRLARECGYLLLSFENAETRLFD